MSESYKQRTADSPFVHFIEWGFAENEGARTFSADTHWYLFVQKVKGSVKLGVSGLMTQALHVPHDAETDCVGIRFTTGAFMPLLAKEDLLNNVLFLPEAGTKSFWLKGSAWEFPTFENVETFINRLVREELLVIDPVVQSTLCNQPPELSLSTVRRRFLRATGLNPGTIFQIERAHRAAEMLRQGVSILDTVDAAGYFDQPHLTRSLKRFLGQTPAQIARFIQDTAPVSA